MRHRTSLAAVLAVLMLAACEDDPTAPAPAGPDPAMEAAAHMAAIHETHSGFHGALHESDREAMRALFTDDATLEVGPASASGPGPIADFFETSPPFVNGWVALAPTYETRIELDGETAEFGFECIYVPATEDGVLAGAEVVAHLHATGTMRKVGEEWLFESFRGGPGPLP